MDMTSWTYSILMHKSKEGYIYLGGHHRALEEGHYYDIFIVWYFLGTYISHGSLKQFFVYK